MPKHRSPEFHARVEAAKKLPDENGIVRPGRKRKSEIVVSKPPSFDQTKEQQSVINEITDQTSGILYRDTDLPEEKQSRAGRKRKSQEAIAIEGLQGYNKKQITQHLRGERIDRTPKIWVRFKDSGLMKLKGAERVKKFFDRYITHTEGRWKGQKWQWVDWQIDFIDRLFGTLKDDGLRQYKECLLEIAKKNGKTELGAGIGLYCLIADNEGAPEVLLAAKDRVQAKKCFEAAERMVNQRKALSDCLKILKSQKKIIYVKESGYLEVVSKDSGTQHGRNISTLIFDELHAQQNRNLFDVLTEGSGAARAQPLFIYLTTAGWDRNSICFEVHQRALKAMVNPENDPSFLGIIYSVPDDVSWEDEANWKLANPALGHIFTIENLKEDYKKAKENPAKENVFRRLRLNQWTSQETKFVSTADWDKCGISLLYETLFSRKCYCGLDLSWTTDITACVLIFESQNGDGIIDILPHFWMPLENLEKKIQTDHLPYDIWIKQGLINGIPGKLIDYDIVRADIINLRKHYNISEIAYDPMNATQMALDLEKEGFIMVQFKQLFTTYTPPMKEFLDKITTGKIRHGGNPILRTHLDSMMVLTDKNNFVMPSKKHSNGRIDGITAAIMAYDRLMRQPKPDSLPRIISLGTELSVSESIKELSLIPEEGKPESQKREKIICKNCGKNIEANTFCPHCGLKVNITGSGSFLPGDSPGIWS